jgi:hypothetical protein
MMMVDVQWRCSLLQALLDRRVILLRGRRVSCLQVFAELLELLLERRLFGLQALHGRIEDAAEYSCYGHGCLPLLRRRGAPSAPTFAERQIPAGVARAKLSA